MTLEVVAPVIEQPVQPPPADNAVIPVAPPPTDNAAVQPPPAADSGAVVASPSRSSAEQPVQSLPEQAAPAADSAVEQSAQPPADAVSEQLLPIEVPAQAQSMEQQAGQVQQGLVAVGQPTLDVPALQPTTVYVAPADMQATIVAPAVVVPPPTGVPAVAAPLGTLPPPSNVVPATAAVVTGQIYGQIITPLRPDSTGITIMLTLPDGAAQQAVTDSRGIFSFANLPSGNYRIDAGAAGYLSSQLVFVLADGQALTLPPVTLIGGDTNADNQIDLSDAALIAANFDVRSATAADLNQDGIVDIRDLTAIGAYFGKSGPVQWQ
ncbi:MAG: carboxypeptidase regulatory-like domain-containing protein [Anaerolineae bacterium]